MTKRVNRVYVPPEKIAKVRSYYGLTQLQCAEILGCHDTTWQKYEKGKRRMRVGVMGRFFVNLRGAA